MSIRWVHYLFSFRKSKAKHNKNEKRKKKNQLKKSKSSERTRREKRTPEERRFESPWKDFWFLELAHTLYADIKWFIVFFEQVLLTLPASISTGNFKSISNECNAIWASALFDFHQQIFLHVIKWNVIHYLSLILNFCIKRAQTQTRLHTRAWANGKEHGIHHGWIRWVMIYVFAWHRARSFIITVIDSTYYFRFKKKKRKTAQIKKTNNNITKTISSFTSIRHSAQQM